MAPGSRKRAAESSEGVAVDNSKKTKPNTEEEATSNELSMPRSKVDANGDRYWEISKLRRVTVSSFKGKIFVHIREYYEKDGQELPGKKGISMPVAQFASLVTLLPEVEAALKQAGESIPRPEYDNDTSQTRESDAQQESSGATEDVTSTKKNIEATSEEEESEE